MSAEWVSAIADSVVAIVAIIATVYAAKQLSTWEKEAKHEVALSVLRAAYKVRNAFDYARNNFDFMFFNLSQPREELITQLTNDFKRHGDLLLERMNVLEDAAVDAEILWGKRKVEQHLRELRKCQRTAFTEMNDFLAALRTAEQEEEVMRIVLSRHCRDELGCIVWKLIQNIDDQLRPLVANKS